MKHLILLILPLFFLACADNDDHGNDFGVTPQDQCLMSGNPFHCNQSHLSNYPQQGNYWSGFHNGGYSHLNGCGNGYFTAANPQRYGLACVGNNYYSSRYYPTSFQNFNRPTACRVNQDCTRINPNTYCNVNRANSFGICLRR